MENKRKEAGMTAMVLNAIASTIIGYGFWSISIGIGTFILSMVALAYAANLTNEILKEIQKS